MSQHMLHIVGPSRFDGVAIIAGDRPALENLCRALQDALACGSGGSFAFQSDGEEYAIAVVMEPDMYPVYTSYAGESAPQRSRRETVPLEQLVNFSGALDKGLRKGEAQRSVI